MGERSWKRRTRAMPAIMPAAHDRSAGEIRTSSELDSAWRSHTRRQRARVRDLREPACAPRCRGLARSATTGKRGRSCPCENARRHRSLAPGFLLRTTSESGERQAARCCSQARWESRAGSGAVLTAHAASASGRGRDQAAEARLEVGRDLQQRPAVDADHRAMSRSPTITGRPRSRRRARASRRGRGRRRSHPRAMRTPSTRAPSPPAVSRTATNA
jgi:hypothetical protein